MNSSRLLKLQYLLIDQLLKEGNLELLLPDGITLQLGITQEDKFGVKKKTEGYCCVVASRNGKSVMLDSYNLGLQFEDEPDTIVYEDSDLNENGFAVRSLDVV